MAAEKVVQDKLLITDLLKSFHLHDYIPSIDAAAGYSKHPVDISTFEDQISFGMKFRSGTIISLTEIKNPYTRLLYEFNKLERGSTVQHLYHGTHLTHIDSISKQNLNHRLFGNSRGSKFGKGVSFSNCPFYSSHYCDQFHNMLYCDVLYMRGHQGNMFTEVPMDGYDVTYNAKGSVSVKYDDDTFYPRYIINFT